ncbi:hypothetical protein SEA_HUBBS_20 [Microbacterium phage Hubbs]|nr:hypothetical protein LUPINE_18 [Microbacterium phage Lupine]QIG58565.1 hypothetical protein SEA_HUBBS_20 [Microbacterium phage Hubbs]
MSQRVVVWRPDDTQTVRVIGPFRSKEKAITAQSIIDLIGERVEADPPFCAEVIELDSLEEALAQIRRDYS